MEQPEQLDYQIYREYEVLQKAGKGTYGIVYKARHKRSGLLVAIKKIIDAFQNLIDAKRTYRELNYLLQLDHPCIVKLQCILHLNRKGLFNQPSTTRLAIPPFSQEERGSNTDKNFSKPPNQAKHVHTVFELMQTDLSCALKKCEQLHPIQRKYIAYQLLHGIAYLHRSGLVHRDIKPSNILLNCNDLEVKICDFGMARLKVDLENSNESVFTEYVASRWYRPPEALLGITTCSEAIDLWGIGCVLAELVLKTPLFQGKSTLDQLQLIMRSIGVPSSKQIDKLSSQQAQYVLKNFSFTKRKKFKSIQQTLNSCSCQEIDLIMNLLKFDPTMRITAEQALKHAYFDDIHQMKVNGQIEQYSRSVAKILDFSFIPLQAKGDLRNSNSNPGIDYYRALIEQLQRYAERSTNRSGNFIQYIDTSKESNINIQNSLHPQGQLEQGFKEKSTKESDFVAMHKHHYLTSTHSLINNVKTQFEAKEKEKSLVQDKKDMKKNQKKKKTFSKADFEKIFQRAEKKEISKNQSKKESFLKPRAESKEKKSLTVIKSKQSLHKAQVNKPLRQKESSQKKLSLTQHFPTSKKRSSASRDNKSLLSNASNTSFHGPSLSKQKGIFRAIKESKGKSSTNQLIQKLNKSTLVLKKSGNPAKSSKLSGHFKKQG